MPLNPVKILTPYASEGFLAHDNKSVISYTYGHLLNKDGELSSSIITFIRKYWDLFLDPIKSGFSKSVEEILNFLFRAPQKADFTASADPSESAETIISKNTREFICLSTTQLGIPEH